MGTREFTQYYETEKEAAEAVSPAARKERATPGYSEIYVQDGPVVTLMTDMSFKWKVTFREYYG